MFRLKGQCAQRPSETVKGSSVSSAPKHRRPAKIRRAGRHAAPTQLDKAGELAGKAAPAAAIAGLLAVGPAYAVTAGTVALPASAAVVTIPAKAVPAKAVPAKAAVITAQVRTDAVVSHDQSASRGSAAQSASRSYTVEPGDNLSAISQRIYGTPADALWLYQANKSIVRNPNLIFPGQVLNLPSSPAIGATARATIEQAPASAPAGQAATGQAATGQAATGQAPAGAPAASSALSGTLGCTGLEALWEEARGAPAEAVTAASIAMAESGGRQYATGGAGERGYWQIHPDHGSLSTYDPLGNAKAAVIISADGTNWTPWTTYTSGLYRGRC